MKNKRFWLILIALIIFVAFIGIAYAATWSSPVNITKNSVYDFDYQLMIEKDNLHTIYFQQEQKEPSEDLGYIYYKRKLSNTSSWSKPVKILSNIYWADSIAVAVYNNHLHVAYVTYGENTGLGLYYKTNKSGSWSKPKKITGNVLYGDYTAETRISMAQQDGKLYIAFVRDDGKDHEVYFTKNTSGTWSTPQPLTNNSLNEYGATLLAKAGKVYAVWSVEDSKGNSFIRYRIFSNGLWSPTSEVTSLAKEKGSLIFYSIDVYDSRPYIAYSTWRQDLYGVSWCSDLTLAYLSSSGKWIKKALTSDYNNTNYSNFSPDIKVINGKVNIVWNRWFDGRGDIWHAKLENGVWSKVNLTKTYWPDESNPYLVYDSKKKKHIVYSGNNDGDYDVYYRNEQ